MKKKLAWAVLAMFLLLTACSPAEDPTESSAEVSADTLEAEEKDGTVSPLLPPDNLPAETEPPVQCSAVIEGIEFISQSTGRPYESAEFSISGSTISFGYPLLASDSEIQNATLRFITDGKIEEKTYDLRMSHEIVLTDSDGVSATYTLEPYRLSYGVPVMQIYTDGGANIESKTEYVEATLYIDGKEYQMKIRGRGNASWTQFAKKSYRIKLNSGASLFGLPQNRDWVLTSNYADKTLIRNQVAHRIAATLDGLEFTSTHISVNLYLNGEYLGVYTFADKIEEGKGRLDFSPKEDDTPSSFGGMDIGFLCEIGWDFDAENIYNRDYFDANKVVRIYVKEPKIEVANSPEFTYVKGYILAMEQAIVTNNGWEDYIDIDSWVDWFILTELTFNTESAFYRSCYMWKREGGKLMLGPVWDFDMAFGNHYGDISGYNGWCTTESTYEYISENWMNYLLSYEKFTSAVKERWNEVKETLLEVALDSIDSCSAALDGSEQQNFIRWPIMTWRIGAGSVDPAVYNTYAKQVEYLRNFVNQRYLYMDERINREF